MAFLLSSFIMASLYNNIREQYYQKDLTIIHDEGFSEYPVKSFPFILKTINKFHKNGLVVELGCGSGITAKKLVRNGFSVIGIDYSSSMIKLAKKRTPNAKFIKGSYHEFKIPGCVAILAIGEVLNYNFDKKTDYISLKKVFKKVYDSLEKNGTFIFDILEENQVGKNKTEKTFVERDNWVVLIEKRENKIKKELERRIVTFHKNKNGYKKQEEIHKVNLYKTDKLIRILINIGFSVKCYKGYGNFFLGNNKSVIVCRK